MSSRFFLELDNVRPPIGHKMGFCTTRFANQTKCPECQKQVWELHQVDKYGNREVCAYCFTTVRENK